MHKDIIRARAPLRLGLAGGGSDVSPFCDIHGGYVLNATIDRYAYTIIEKLSLPVIRFNAADQNSSIEVVASNNLLLDGAFNLHKAVYNHMINVYNNGIPIFIELTTFCDAPAGSGLGSSSTLVVAMVRAYSELFNLALDDYLISQIAFKIERIDCKMQGGRQDQYSATFGGFNFMEFYSNERVLVNPLRVKNWIVCELEASLILYFTGVSRKSSLIIADQSNNITSGESVALNAMHGIKREALVMKDCLLRGDFVGFVESMRQGWENKKQTSKSVSNSEIDEIYNSALEAGALSGKVSGAGGGGFMWFFTPSEKRMDVIRVLKQFGGQVSNCHFTKNGAESWKL